MQLLGKRMEGPTAYWKVTVSKTDLSLLQCPICNIILSCENIRQKHEMSKHSSLLDSIHIPAVNSVPSAANAASNQQLYLFNYLQLCLANKDEPDIIIQLARRHNLLKALKRLGPKTIGLFKCHFCRYEIYQ